MSDSETDPLDELERAKVRAKADPRIGQLIKACRAGDVERVRELLASGADPNQYDPFDGDSLLDPPLMVAVFARAPDVVRVLARAGAHLTLRGPHDSLMAAYDPLVVAAGWGHVELIAALVESGADVNRPDHMGVTPLDAAVREKHADAIARLLDAGADPTFVSPRARERGNHGSPLDYAVQHKEILDVFLAHGVSAETIGPLLLWGAAVRGDAAEVKRLLDAGADINAPNAHGQTPLAGAALMGHGKVVSLLLSRGADVTGGPTSSRENTPLVAAVCSGKLPIVKAIAEAGGGEAIASALDYAKHCRLKKITEYLLEVQAKAGPSSPAMPTAPRPTGVPTFDVNDACVLVEAPVEAVAAAIKMHVGAAIVEANAYGKKVKLTKRSFAVFRVVGQPWSIVMRLIGDHLKARDAQAMSQSLKARAMFVASGDTAGVYHYVTFHDGTGVELFDTGSIAYAADRDALPGRVLQWFGVDLGAMKDVTIGEGIVFASSLRKADLARVGNPLEFINDHIKRENAFVPFFGDEWGRAGKRVELVVEGLGPDDVERMDYVAV